jgi:hypothetical protein
MGGEKTIELFIVQVYILLVAFNKSSKEVREKQKGNELHSHSMDFSSGRIVIATPGEITFLTRRRHDSESV